MNTNILGVYKFTIDSVKADNMNFVAADLTWVTSRTISIGAQSSYNGNYYLNTCSDKVPFLWGDKTVTGSGSYSTILKNIYGCDSFATVNFIINFDDSTLSRDTICFSQFPYYKYGRTFNSIGTYYTKLYNGQATYSYSSDSATLNAKLLYLYQQMYAFGSGGSTSHSNFGQKANDLSSDLMGNDMVVHSQGYGWFNKDYQYSETQNSNILYRPYYVRRRYYYMLYTIKGILDAVNNSSISTNFKEKFKGQCYGLRAYCYYYLINYYQQTYIGNEALPGIPIIKDNIFCNNTYGSVQDIYNLIDTDLTNAISLLGNKTFSDKSTFGISVAYGFKARVALLKQDWSNASLYANLAYTSMGNSTLMTSAQYKQGFNSTSNPEWIWGSIIDANNATLYASFFSHMDATANSGVTYAGLGTQKKITKYLYDLIPANDVRKQIFKAPGTGTTSVPDYCQLKFKLANPSSWAADYLYMRTAEMYLIEAEAKARLGNDIGAKTVLETLIQTRNTSYSAAAYSGTSLINEILLQRRIELWGEGFSLIDLNRTNAGLNRPTGVGNHGNSNFNPIVYTLPAGSSSMIWVTSNYDSGKVIPCEKIDKLIITKKVINQIINKSVCVSQLPYNWNGNDYTSTGFYTYFTTNNNNSCDSLAILNLTIVNNPSVNTISYTPLSFGDTLKLNLSAINTTTYSWSGPNGFSSSLQNPVIPNFNGNHQGKYYVTVGNGGCNIIDSIVVNGSGLYSIVGSIKTINSKIIRNVNLSLSSNVNWNIFSSLNGYYNFFSLNTNNYILRPTKNNDINKANGVNSVDALLVQRDILNTTKLNSPYKIIAADVNGDKVINSVDVLRMKRLILGTDTTFVSTLRGSRLWEFVDSAYQFPDTTNPFPFKDSISFTNLTSNKINQTFIGVKLGDVNYDWNSAVARLSTVGSQQLTDVELVANSEWQMLNGELRIPITVNNFNDIAAMQYTLHFDNTKYEFVGIENNKLNIDFNSSKASETGHIAMLWTDKNAEEKTLKDGTDLFILVLRAKGLGTWNWELGISNDITEIAAWDKDFNQHNITLKKRETINDKLEIRNESFSVSPNPTSGEVKISIESKLHKVVIIELTDIYGKIILTQAVAVNKGSNTIILNLKQNKNIAAGLYLLHALGLEGETKKLIIK
ncbi:MAG: RagB/SusD family nutrient uptake outer membrane protein [Chitinophagaceae bacterium]